MIIYRWVSETTAPAVQLPPITAFDRLLGDRAAQTYVVDLRAVDVPQMQQINTQYRQLEQPTDILSFPLYASVAELPTTDAPLGDLIICPAMMDSEHLTGDEIVTHGVLHLLGFDHEADQSTWDAAVQQVISAHV